MMNHFEKKKKLDKVVETFRRKRATTPDNAISIDDLELYNLKELVKAPLGRLGVFVEVNGKYYLSEDRLREVKEQISKVRQRRFRHLLRHTASVPKGFLRHHMLMLLREKSRSGSEIMEAISKQTDGRWKPSPGSVYPLLAWFKDNDFTTEVPTEKSGIKRYQLTEKGILFFEEQISEQLQQKLEFSPPFFFEGFGLSLHSQNIPEIHEPVMRLMTAFFNLRMALRESLSKQTIKNIGELLSETTDKIEELSERIRKGE